MVRTHLELTAPKALRCCVLVTLLTPDGLVQASLFSPSLSSRLSPISLTRNGQKQVLRRCRYRRRRLERLPVEASMTIPSFYGDTVYGTGTVNAHRACSLLAHHLHPFSYLGHGMPIAVFCAMNRKRSIAVRLNPHCKVCRTPTPAAVLPKPDSLQAIIETSHSISAL